MAEKWDETKRVWQADHGLLDDEQVAQCERADVAEPLRGPIPTRMISNGEYMPIAQTREQKRVEARYVARERIAAMKDSAAAGSDSAAPQAGYSAERRVPLHFLAGGLSIVSVVSLVMLSRWGRSVASKDRPEVVEPQRR